MQMKTIVTAAVVAMGAVLSTTAYAELNWGPDRNGNQCWKFSAKDSHNGYGYWETCPAAVATTTTAVHHARHHQKKSS
jgi:hypothetical protein